MAIAKTLYEQAEAAEANQDLNLAATLYRQILNEEKNPGVYGALAWILLRQEDLKAALSMAKQMRQLAEKYNSDALAATAMCLIGWIHEYSGRRKLAEKYYRESLTTSPNAEAWFFLGNLIKKDPGTTEEKVCYQRALELDPLNAEARYALACWYYRHNDLDRTLWQLRLTVGDSPEFEPAVVLLTFVLWQYDQTGIREAQGLLQNAVLLNPNSYELIILAAINWYLSGKNKQALKVLHRAVIGLPPESRLYTAYATILYIESRSARDAELFYERAIELNPVSAAAHYYYGLFLKYEQRFEEAVSMLVVAEQLGSRKAVDELEEFQTN